MIRKSEINLKNIFYYIQGNLRYNLYYSYFKFLIPRYIREQIKYRINSMDRQCLKEGQCKECGCDTPHLQMSNKTCKGICYPTMIGRKTWNTLRRNNCIKFLSDNYYWSIVSDCKMFIKFNK